MYQGLTLLGGIGLGAGLMYLLDPDVGRRRRSLLRHQAASAVNRIDDCIDATARDVTHRAQGLAAEVRSRLAGGAVPDDVLVERVRSRMGRFASHPHAIQVTTRDGRVMLGGPILEREVGALLRCVSSVGGVREVENRLEVHQQAGDIPALQGGWPRPGERPNLLEVNWAPATRLLAGMTGGALLAFGFTRRFPIACVLGTAGLALLARAITNTELKRLAGLGGGRRAVDVHKTITIAAPVEQIFDFWASYENFPRFMAHLREVRDLGGGRSHWVAEGPAGVPASWDASLTRVIPYELMTWQSEPGSVIANAGVIRFEPTDDRGTRVDIRLSYNPPAGALGHLAALLFGADPKSAMDEDLVRLKSLLEQGKASAPGKRVTREELAAEA